MQTVVLFNIIGWHEVLNFQGFVRLVQTPWGAGHTHAKMLLDVHQMELAGCLFSIFCLKGRARILVCFAFYLMNARYYITAQVGISLIWSQSSCLVLLRLSMHWTTGQVMENILLNLWGPKRIKAVFSTRSNCLLMVGVVWKLILYEWIPMLCLVPLCQGGYQFNKPHVKSEVQILQDICSVTPVVKAF